MVGSLRGSLYSQSSQYRDRSTWQRLQEEMSCAYQPFVKLFNQPECRVLCEMIVAEDQDEIPPPDIFKGDQLTTEQLDQLQVVYDLAKDTFSDEPGTTDVCTHVVDTGNCKLILMLFLLSS